MATLDDPQQQDDRARSGRREQRRRDGRAGGRGSGAGWRRRPVKRSFIWTHRWTSLVLGLALLVVTTSGVPLLYQQEIMHAKHSQAFSAAGPAKLTLAETLPIAQKHDPKFVVQSIYKTSGVYVAANFESERQVTIDPSNGKVLGDFTPSKDPGVVAWSMSLLQNIHMCGLTCPEYVGYQSWLNTPVPGTGRLGFDGADITIGGLILGITGLLLLFLALSGIWMWWPGIKRMAVGVRVRFRKGRYARDFDLHQVAGMIAVPLLLMWAFTGMGYEFGCVEKAWYAATPGEPHGERELASIKADAARHRHRGRHRRRPEARRGERGADRRRPAGAKEATATYGVWFANGFDPWRGTATTRATCWSPSTGTMRHASKVTYGGDEPRAQGIWEDWNFSTHAGLHRRPVVRIIWVVLGLAPLLLAFTGVSTWLYKRSLRKRRRQAAAAAAPA